MQGEATPRILRQPDREYDVLGRQIPRNPFKGAPGLRLLMGLGFAELWQLEVPEEYVAEAVDVETRQELRTIACACGESIVAPLQAVAFCPADCGRWFLPLRDVVLVKRWPREVAA